MIALTHHGKGKEEPHSGRAATWGDASSQQRKTSEDKRLGGRPHEKEEEDRPVRVQVKKKRGAVRRIFFGPPNERRSLGRIGEKAP